MERHGVPPVTSARRCQAQIHQVSQGMLGCPSRPANFQWHHWFCQLSPWRRASCQGNCTWWAKNRTVVTNRCKVGSDSSAQSYASSWHNPRPETCNVQEAWSIVHIRCERSYCWRWSHRWRLFIDLDMYWCNVEGPNGWESHRFLIPRPHHPYIYRMLKNGWAAVTQKCSQIPKI